MLQVLLCMTVAGAMTAMLLVPYLRLRRVFALSQERAQEIARERAVEAYQRTTFAKPTMTLPLALR